MKITLNGKSMEAREGETILSAARRMGLDIPTLCHMEGLPPTGTCRVCVVEDRKTGRLIPSCSFPVSDGMDISTHSNQAVAARKTIIELLLASHPDDCLYCPGNGTCVLQRYAQELGVRQRSYSGARNRIDLDVSSPSIIRDPEKCILCGRCVRVCSEVQGVSAIDFTGRGSAARISCAFNEGLNVSSCVNCGQCVMVCPTGALTERRDVDRVLRALDDPEMTVVVQHAPAVSVTLAEEFGIKPGSDIVDRMNAAFRRMGFDKVFPTSFSADLTVMEEAHELVQRVRSGGPFPMFTSCSPGWIKYLEEFYPQLLGNASSCKSPQQMMGAVIKRLWAPAEGLDPKNVFSVSVMPCTAKKFEASRPEMGDGAPDVDAVITTRELAEMVRMFGIDISSLDGEEADSPFGERSSAGKLFGASGGVMEAAARTAYHMLTGENLKELKIEAVRGLEDVKETSMTIAGIELRLAVVSGLGNAGRLLRDIIEGRRSYHFVEVMTCPGGCINGGGQPFLTDPERVKARMQSLYEIDRNASLRVAHENKSITALYRDHLGEPGSREAHHLLHTTYSPREVLK
jgi:NADH-quinone oxidoreductase subunit G/NADP-reducing hydrogenase subunit HndD